MVRVTMTSEQDERLQTELSLLDAMYPGQVAYDAKSREVKYGTYGGAFQLRLPEGYLSNALPEVLSASVGRSDVREQLRKHVQACNAGEEVLDSIILEFTGLVESIQKTMDAEITTNGEFTEVVQNDSSKATVVVWLHHLLNTNKRKQALSPSSPDVSGVTKPGYPGVLIYSGPMEAVHDHVNELKQLNWQAFQIRLESDEEWIFTHVSGVKEVETMKEVVAGLGEERRELFMEAMRMK